MSMIALHILFFQGDVEISLARRFVQFWISKASSVWTSIWRLFKAYDDRFGTEERVHVNLEDDFHIEFSEDSGYYLALRKITLKTVRSNPATRIWRDFCRLAIWLAVILPKRRFGVLKDARVSLSLLWIVVAALGIKVGYLECDADCVLSLVVCFVTALFDREYKTFFSRYDGTVPSRSCLMWTVGMVLRVAAYLIYWNWKCLCELYFLINIVLAMYVYSALWKE